MAPSATTNEASGGMPDVAALVAKYGEEKAKRLRSDGLDQYVELQEATSSRLSSLGQDPWVDHAALNSQPSNIKDGDDIKVLVLGAGFGGILHAVHLTELGLDPNDIRVVDTAGGWGGTWYWNRYPGLMCDVESAMYLPLLEETGYVPKHKFSYGFEIRDYLNQVAEKWKIHDKGVFRTKINSLDWKDENKRWHTSLTQNRGPNADALTFNVTAQFVIIAKGVLNFPKAPKFPGIEDFKGDIIHTARWNYDVTGGSPTDWTLSKLKGKKVAIVGTGATAIQCAPQLAEWADQLYVIQRTPSAVHPRGQGPTDPEEWKKITAERGWWHARNKNYLGTISGEPGIENLINDAWSNLKAYKYLVGGPHDKPVTMEDIPNHIGYALAIDAPDMECVRKRVEDTVTKDTATAEALKPWYPSWCKRPCFHDDYLPMFNRPNVTLLDTNGKGVDSVTPTGLVVSGKEYDVDVVVLSTGFRSPIKNNGDPSFMANMTVTGRNGTLLKKWETTGPATLHGVLTHSFPNFFLTGPAQSGAGANFGYTQEVTSRHSAYIITEALKRAESPALATVEVSPEAEGEWTMQIMMRAAWSSPVGVCTPSYLNGEGQLASQEEMMKAAQGAPYALGMNAFAKVAEAWREEGSMKGVTVS
ncbi:hypothetical protein S40285_08625 [Stachybotrys chlorohalonatus IBT 40285]|uniref:FAD/NAD(P)-binding domain-containing protein n=1 Tax=Stachybotrys chlorohalonatus (strain IBT 40285) TaxID=1283841 RepID=A0A084QW08_STAC4|nr:hypothetical protein S40285_08625 [Stachybotrys chlorohalonata IBT 40285]